MNEFTRSFYAIISILLIGFILIITGNNSSAAEITEDEIMNHIRYLSHENREGRLPGTRGSKDVIAYLVKNFKSFGVKPGIKGSYAQPFDIQTGIQLGKENMLVVKKDSLTVSLDYLPLSFSATGNFFGEAVFAGYGFQIEEENLKWDDYEGLDVKDKWVIVMRHSPEREEPHSIYTRYSSMHKKMLVARDNGALGIIFVSQVEDDDLYPLNYFPGVKNDNMPAIILSKEKANLIFDRLGWSIKKIQQTMNRNLKPLNFQLGVLNINATISLDPIISRGANVVGEIRSRNRQFRDEYILIGAHFDHIGLGGPGSGSRYPEKDQVHPGADDNASGVSGLLELAQKLSANINYLKRSVLLVGFDAEEKGLLGSKHFIQSSPINLNNVISMINMDMIGRMSDSTYTVGGVGTSPSFKYLLDSLKQGRLFNLTMNSPGFGPSDHAPFYSNDIPVLFFFSGFHDDYHTPNDTWQKINLRGEKHILDFIYDLVFYLSRAKERPVFQESGPKKNQMNEIRNFKVTFGIMPSYGSAKVGLEVSSISKKDGPAAKAGMKEGDVIKSINNKPIKDIYEYMDRLNNINPGMTIPVVIERDGKIKTVKITF